MCHQFFVVVALLELLCNSYHFGCVVDAVYAVMLSMTCCCCRWLTSYQEGDVKEENLAAISDVDSYDDKLLQACCSVVVVPFVILQIRTY